MLENSTIRETSRMVSEILQSYTRTYGQGLDCPVTVEVKISQPCLDLNIIRVKLVAAIDKVILTKSSCVADSIRTTI